jgi:hypothetical protein
MGTVRDWSTKTLYLAATVPRGDVVRGLKGCNTCRSSAALCSGGERKSRKCCANFTFRTLLCTECSLRSKLEMGIIKMPLRVGGL